MLSKLNKPLITCVLLITGMGLLALWTTAPPASFTVAQLTKSIFLKQAIFVTGGLALMGLVALPHYQHYRRASTFLYMVCIVALIFLLWKGRSTRGTRGWFAVGPFHVQPAEFMKIAAVLTLARVLMYARHIQKIRGLILPTLLAAVPAGLVLLQPDLGTAILFVPTVLAMLWAAGAKKRHLALMVAALMVAAPVAYFTVLKPYQRNRLIAFVVPDKVPPDMTYQKRQSERAVASGRAFGREGDAVPFYVPDRPTDFAYSTVAEELGFIGSTFLLFLFVVFFGQSLRIAHQSREPFARLMVTGLATLLATQTLINIGMTIGVGPITGVTLPFVSYGGSSLLMCMITTGLILNVAARWQPGFSSRDMAGGSVNISGFQPQSVKWPGF